ncbi:MAG: hypothetical protein J6Q15_02680 [Clostridia bacterium]|nr:hypothetical protein [Clostridia bacterium]
MINVANKLIHVKPILKQNIKLTLKPLTNLEDIDIFAMPSRIQDNDIIAMFKGLMKLMREKIQQEQTQKFLTLKLKYERLKYLYEKVKQTNLKN